MAGTLMLTDVPRALKDLTGTGIQYQKLYRHIIDGAIPAEKSLSGRWFVRRADLPEIAKTLGLTKDENK